MSTSNRTVTSFVAPVAPVAPAASAASRAIAAPVIGARAIPAFALAFGALALALAPRLLPAQTLTLEDAVRAALLNNRDLRTAHLQVDVAEKQVAEAWSTVFPTVELNASYTRNISPAVSFLPAQIVNPDAGPDEFVAIRFGADNAWSSNIRFEQPLFQAKAFLGVGASGRFRELQEETVRGVAHSIVTRVRISYYSVLLAREQERLLNNSVQRVRSALSEAQAMNRAGMMSEYDVLRLEVELGNLEPNLRRAENAVVRARRDLAVELNSEAVEGSAVVGVLSELNIDDPAANTPANLSLLMGGLPSTVAENRDELIAASMTLRSDVRQLVLVQSLRHTEMRVEQVEYLPRVSLFGNYIINAQQNGGADFFGHGAQERAYSRLAGIQVTVPVFAGMRESARTGQKRAALRQAETNTDLVRDRAEAQVRSLLDEVEESRLRAQAQKKAVTQAQRGFDIASAQFREGIGSQLERTDAEVALRQSEFNYAQAVFDYLAARARLDEATGMVPLADDATRRGTL
jgi:outer membrane protein TolC